MVNKAGEGQRQERPWWWPVAILTREPFNIRRHGGKDPSNHLKSLVPPGVSRMIAGAEQLYQVTRMIKGIGNVLFSTFSQSLNW